MTEQAQNQVETPVEENVIDIFNEFAQDEKGEEEGVLVKLPGAGNTLWRIARHGNPKYMRLYDELYTPKANFYKKKTPEAEAALMALDLKINCLAILTGWEGEVLFKGEKLKYSFENAKKLMAHKEFRNLVLQFAMNRDTFKAVKDQEIEGN